jgi:hypothetical protein
MRDAEKKEKLYALINQLPLEGIDTLSQLLLGSDEISEVSNETK